MGGDWDRDGDWAKIVIMGTGIGIPGEFQENIFQAFNRGGASSDKQSGTGLGLALVKSLTELHGGRVELDSVAGRGTTITIFLPLESRLVDQAAG